MPDPKRPRRTYPQLLVTAAAAGLLLAACGGGGGASAPESTGTAATSQMAGIVRDQPVDVSTVTLPDASSAGAPFTMRAEPGQLLMVYFGYTGCPDVCPTSLGDLRRARSDLGAEGDRMKVAMVTVDPERDTAELLTSYMAHFFDDAHALRTDDTAQLESAKAAFGVESRRNATSDPGVFTFDHTATVFAVDETGHIVMEWPYGTTASAIAADVGTLLKEQT